VFHLPLGFGLDEQDLVTGDPAASEIDPEPAFAVLFIESHG
jgi:hypothetical protein